MVRRSLFGLLLAPFAVPFIARASPQPEPPGAAPAPAGRGPWCERCGHEATWAVREHFQRQWAGGLFKESVVLLPRAYCDAHLPKAEMIGRTGQGGCLGFNARRIPRSL